MDQGALGLIETKGLVAAIEAADAALKAASVRLVGVHRTNPALMTVHLVGETAAVHAAVDAAKAAAERVGTVVSTHVIPRPAIDVAKMQSLGDSGEGSPKASKPSAAKAVAPSSPAKAAAPSPPAEIAAPSPPAEIAAPSRPAQIAAQSPPAKVAAPPPKEAGNLASMTVRELRALARSMEGLPIQGREIARANKAELLQALGR